MEIKKKNKKLMISATGLVSMLALPGLVQAPDGTVILSAVSTDILNLSGNVAGATDFTLDLSDRVHDSTVNAFFEARANVDQATSNLINVAVGSPATVEDTEAGTLYYVTGLFNAGSGAAL